MTTMQVAILLVGGLLALGARLSASPAPLPSSVNGNQNTPIVTNFRQSRLPDVWEVLARHGALDVDHQMARKSARSPSRRLRFGRRSDPLMPPEPMLDSQELENLQDELFNRQSRAPVRMRFGRRSLETAVPHIFPVPDQNDEELRKEIRAPSMRLRFGRRSDIFMAPYEQAEREYRADEGTMDTDE